jgi:hypothetical protein
MVALEARPTLEWVVMPRSSGEVLVAVQIAVGQDHILMSIHRGRGHEPVTVQGRTWSAVTVNIASTPINWATAN